MAPKDQDKQAEAPDIFEQVTSQVQATSSHSRQQAETEATTEGLNLTYAKVEGKAGQYVYTLTNPKTGKTYSTPTLRSGKGSVLSILKAHRELRMKAAEQA